MKFLNSKAILVAGVILLGGGATLLWATSEPIILTTDLDHPKQYIQTTVVAVTGQNGGWKYGSTITTTGGAITIAGSIVGNSNGENIRPTTINPCCENPFGLGCQNTADPLQLCPKDLVCCKYTYNTQGCSNYSTQEETELCGRCNTAVGEYTCPTSSSAGTFSILGGQGNIMGNVTESTIGGGMGNTILAPMSFIGGGSGNYIGTHTGGFGRNTILGGIKNFIGSGSSDSVILGGSEHSITGNFSTIIGSRNNKINGNASLAAGSGTHIGTGNISTNGTFARNDGSKIFTVTQSNIFAINATNGVVVGRERPHPGAALSLSRAIRIQPSVKDATGCNATLAGTMKSVKITGSEKLCLCACADNAWQSLINDKDHLCPSTCAGTTPPPPPTGPSCGSLGECIEGTRIGDKTFKDRTAGDNHHTTRSWNCITGTITQSCTTGFTCQGPTPQNANPCGPNSLSQIDISKTKVVLGVCNYYDKCEYVCKHGFEFDREQGKCVAPAPINGRCNPAYDTMTFSDLTAGNHLCAQGTIANFVSLSPLPLWKRSCLGVNGGTSDDGCFAFQATKIDGVCGSIHGGIADTPPSGLEACLAGTYSAPSAGFGIDATKYTWRCLGIGGGADRDCFAYKPTQSEGPACNDLYHGQEWTDLTAGNHLCNPGYYQNFRLIGSVWRWQCTLDPEGRGTAVNCSATKITGIVGPDIPEELDPGTFEPDPGTGIVPGGSEEVNPDEELDDEIRPTEPGGGIKNPGGLDGPTPRP